MRTNKMLAPLAFAAALTCYVPASKAADSAIEQKAANYLQKEAVAKDILGMLHSGANYLGTKNLGYYDVTDTSGRKIPGEFAVKIRHYWSAKKGSNDYTDVTYFFDDKGRFKNLRVGDTTAILNQPFALSGLFVEVVKEALIEKVKNDPNREQLTRLIRGANAKGVLELMIALGQP